MKKVRNLQKLIPLLPLLLLAILFIFLPIISMVQKSFLSPETGAFTFNNYKTIFTDSVYQVATSNSLYLSFASTIIGLILSFFIAWAVNELGKNGQSRMLSMLNMVSNFCWFTTLFFICSYSWKHRNFCTCTACHRYTAVYRFPSVFHPGAFADVYLLSAAPGQPDAGSCFSGSGLFLEGSS